MKEQQTNAHKHNGNRDNNKTNHQHKSSRYDDLYIKKNSNNKIVKKSGTTQSKAAKSKAAKSKKLRRYSLMYNVIFILFVLLLLVYGCFRVFTDKKSLRNEGIEYFNNAQYDKAIACFDDALDCEQWFSNKVDVDILLYKAESLIKLEKFTEASKVYKILLEVYPDKYYDKDKIEYMVKITENLNKYKEGDYNSTLASINAGIELGYTELALYAVNIYESINDYENMKANLDIYSNKFGVNSYVCYEYAQYYLANSDYDNCLRYIEQGISFNDEQYLRQLLYSQILCYTKKLDYQKAYELSKSFINKYPDDKDGIEINSYLDTRINIDDTLVNDIYNINEK